MITLRRALLLLPALAPRGLRAQQPGLRLITAREAGLPPLPEAEATRAITRGPTIRYVSPRTAPVEAETPFWFRLEFEARGGGRINPAATRLELLRGGHLDITPRVRDFLQAGFLDVPAALAPAGRHPLRVTVADEQGRVSTQVIEIDVR